MANEVKNISIDSLVAFANHPFRLYDEDSLRFAEMKESISESGILNPLLIRPKTDETYEILSGHNRVNAARQIGLTEVPCIVFTELNDDEATLIVTETNFNQRSFADLKHSERAKAICLYMDSIKAIGGQGRRNDLLKLIFDVDNCDNHAENSTSVQLEQKLWARGKASDKFGLSDSNVQRYTRLTKLSGDLMKRVDTNELGVVPAVYISFLSHEEQELLETVVAKFNKRISLNAAKLLKEQHDKGKPITEDFIIDALTGNVKKRSKPHDGTVKLNKRVYTEYIGNKTGREAAAYIEQALKYFQAAVERGEADLTNNEIDE